MIEITRMEPTDTAEVLAIERASQADPWSEAAFMEELGKPHSLVLVARLTAPEPRNAEERGDENAQTAHPLASPTSVDVVGYVCLWIVAGEAQILNLAVHPVWRRQGIGRILLAHALTTAQQRRAQKAVLEVRKGNLAAQKLYEGLGFKRTGERPNFYAVIKEAAILMELDLDSRWLSQNTPNVIPACFWRESSHTEMQAWRWSGFPPKACGNDGSRKKARSRTSS